jgi:predicted nucleic acid-binding protein
VRDQSSLRAKKLLRDVNVVAWWATAVEGRGAFVRLQREGLLSDVAFRVSCERLSAVLSSSKEVLPSDKVREIAFDQLERYALRAGNALQLAAALVWCRERPRGRWFVCNDQRLRSAAAASGFEVQSV